MWGLTVREREVIDAVIAHGRWKDAAHSLGLSVKTVEAHLNNVYCKSGLTHIAPIVAAYVTAKLNEQWRGEAASMRAAA